MKAKWNKYDFNLIKLNQFEQNKVIRDSQLRLIITYK